MDLKHRVLTAFGQSWSVPRHINPIKTGWQVRFARKSEPYFSKSFSNNQWGSAHIALEMATEELKKQLSTRQRTEELDRKHGEMPKIQFSTTGGKGRWDNKSLSASIFLCAYQGKFNYSHVHVGVIDSVSQVEVDSAIRKLVGDWFWAVEQIALIGVDGLVSEKPPTDTKHYIPDGYIIPHYPVKQLLTKYFKV